ncbi:MAG: hypothetical protein SFT94_06780 [Pseudanabaenaceae cyanobacterium bins.68]|nr:hypothetical protein [Pseudanabaenaceae cyanobacterium bins.68]
MELWEQICRQRIKYIVDCYQLDLTESPEDFADLLEELWLAYPYAQIELALVETLVASWLQIPPVKGIPFLEHVHRRLQSWENYPQVPTQITPAQFQQIAGLDPRLVFGNSLQISQVSQVA